MGLPKVQKPPPNLLKVQKQDAVRLVATWTLETQVGLPVSHFSALTCPFQVREGEDRALLRGRTLYDLGRISFAGCTLDDMGKNDRAVAVAGERKGRYCDRCSELLVHP